MRLARVASRERPRILSLHAALRGSVQHHHLVHLISQPPMARAVPRPDNICPNCRSGLAGSFYLNACAGLRAAFNNLDSATAVESRSRARRGACSRHCSHGRLARLAAPPMLGSCPGARAARMSSTCGPGVTLLSHTGSRPTRRVPLSASLAEPGSGI
ncbi:hypothetical protein EJ06DRAFT_43672 [Trichodelitschia bisporula]|uniref:Uncharacterized protein n=1 Tax=Trichodelitschia bisporula TaxID=703511 RepID=A0A6G1HW00_9PEZI|nr:hypothetical protein EJ06DRAFT_43672 [Trichodelitschia bisporula]